MLVRILSRVSIFLASLLASSILVFLVMTLLPGDPARVALGVNASDEAVATLRHTYGLDRALPVQYLEWLKDLVTFDLGKSYISGALIAPQIADRLQVTLLLVIVSMVIALIVSLPLGTLSAVRHRHLDGVALSAVSQIGVSVPAFLLGILLIALFAVTLGWLPAGGWTPPAQGPGLFARQILLPALSLGVVQGAVVARYVRSSVIDVMREDYIRTARAKGLRPMPALIKHGLRNASIPVVTVLALQLATLLIGAVVVERVFVIPGLGSLLLDSVSNRDLLMVQDVVMVLVVAVLLVNLLVEVLYVVIDPRLRTVGGRS